ncbi:MAG: BMP family ABC transporter substrate-binding protein [Rubrivivax sp.]|jgi:simple sugar transport system substrate-binding protein|nr:BMP family ABC transporter substrate-binding protein [Rubrivivax sp.]
MTDLTKRRWLSLAGFATVAAAAGLAGCGKKEEAPPPAPAPVASAPAPKPEPLKAAWIYIGPVGDGGWSFQHDLGRKAVEAEFGDKVATTFVEKVAYGDAERVIRDLASQGNKLIFATSFGYMDPMQKVAAEFPDVKFEHATGYKTGPNMNVYDARFYHDTYVSGILAGGMTKTNTLGFVGSFPIPEVLRNINSFTLGAQSVNPKVKVRVVWIGSWFDPEKEGAAAQELINQGADVLLQNTDSTAVLQTAAKNNKFAFGWDSDMSAVAPEAHLASNIVDWGPYYKKTVAAVLDGTWQGGQRTIWGKPEGANAVIKINETIPQPIRTKAEEAAAAIKGGTFDPFTGPIVDNTGKERLAKDVKADQDWKDKVDFYVKGVEGKVPASK